MNDIVKFFDYNLKKKNLEGIFKFIKDNFIFLYENIHILFEIEPYLEKIYKFKVLKDPLFYLLFARLYSAKHKEEFIKEIYQEIDLNSLEKKYHPFYYYTVALYYFNRKKFNLALKILKSGFEFSDKEEREPDIYIKSKIENLKGIISFHFCNYTEALKHFQTSHDLSENMNISESGKRGIMENIAMVYFVKGDFEECINICGNILKNTKERNYDYRIFRKIAASFLNLGDFERAEKYIIEALQNLEKFKGPEFYKIFIFMDYVDILINKNKFCEAEKYTKRIIQLKNKYSFLDIKSNVDLTLIKYFLIKGDLDKVQELITNFKETDNHLYLSEYFLYSAIFNFYKKDYTKAEEYYRKTIYIAPTHSFISKLSNFIYSFYLLSKGYEDFLGLLIKKNFPLVFENFFDNKGELKMDLTQIDIIKRFSRFFI